MAQERRSKGIWLIPKRSNLHQIICLIDGILQRDYDGKIWDPSKQNNLGVNLKNWGATNDGRNISNQAMRTLLALAHYLGFLYLGTVDNKSALRLTEAGKLLHKTHKEELVQIRNLRKDRELTIKESEVALKQMEKLQITNPVILKDCRDISVFPFRATIEILLEVDYLDKEEIAYYIFQIKNQSEINSVIRKIKDFRRLSNLARKEIIDPFLKTNIGNITLGQAPSSTYYMSLCAMTGIVEKTRVSPENKEQKINAIRIKNTYKDYCKQMIDTKYRGVPVYDFKDDLNLWIDYIGDPTRIFPPIDVAIVNTTNSKYLIRLVQDGKQKDADMLEEYGVHTFPMFPNEEYCIEVINIHTGSLLHEDHFIPDYNHDRFELPQIAQPVERRRTVDQIMEEILAHSDCQHFTGEFHDYLTILARRFGIDKTQDPSLRGAYYESLFYDLLCELKGLGVIDDVSWFGGIGKYGLPVPAPGGKTGTPDIVFKIDNIDFVLELTTIKAKSRQEKAELPSVPDHIILYAESHSCSKRTIGVFCAPQIHDRTEKAMKQIVNSAGHGFVAKTDKELLSILASKNRHNIIASLDV